MTEMKTSTTEHPIKQVVKQKDGQHQPIRHISYIHQHNSNEKLTLRNSINICKGVDKQTLHVVDGVIIGFSQTKKQVEIRDVQDRLRSYPMS